MDIKKLKDSIKGVDIYLLDQILKGLYKPGDKILDVGCGKGRNLKWFYQNDYEVHGIDMLDDRILHCKQMFDKQSDHFMVSSIEDMTYSQETFDHLICNAVLHFAENPGHFKKLFGALLEILKPQGSLFIRMASDFGIQDQIVDLSEGVFKLPDGSERFLLTADLLEKLLNEFPISLIETVKTTLVHDKRCMTTLVLKKEL